jgi:hypothetical protein
LILLHSTLLTICFFLVVFKSWSPLLTIAC